ncbi:MAG: radical SAM protein [Candidatus Micrarchaeota archaeon]
MRLALGTAMAMGLRKGKMESAPTTAHFLLGDGCEHSCAYCGARDSKIARIEWPEFPGEKVMGAPFSGFKRACLQLTSNGLEEAVALIPKIPLPVSVSLRARGIGEVERLFSAGADRVCVPLDACTGEISESVGRGGFRERVALLKWAAGKFPGKIATHLIVGLGESERDAVELMRELYASGVYVGLFAFTPVKGSALEARGKPHLGAYRRVQIARHLIAKGKESEHAFKYNARGQIIGLPEVEGEAFLTSGCPGCNRPYFDSAPSKLYNYPREMSEEERRKANSEARVYEGKKVYKAGKLIKINLEYSSYLGNTSKIENIRITGDFFVYPEEGIERIERGLVGCPLEKEGIRARAARALENVEVFGFDADSLTEAVMGAVG